VVYDLRQGIRFPEGPERDAAEWSSWNRLRATLAGQSYLEDCM
jgi:hypothetical protein